METDANPLGALARIRQSPAPALPRPGERCELCGEDVPDEHGHVVDLEARTLMCSCRGCYLLFSSKGAGGGHFKAVGDRSLSFPDIDLSPAQWDALQIPVSVAFFFVNSTIDRMCAFYPSPAGATESLLSLDTWAEVASANPALATLEPDVEAFLVRTDPKGLGGAPECYLVPIDWCYELVGTLRQLWRGFDGGQDVRRALDTFFAGVADRARVAGAA